MLRQDNKPVAFASKSNNMHYPIINAAKAFYTCRHVQSNTILTSMGSIQSYNKSIHTYGIFIYNTLSNSLILLKALCLLLGRPV